MIIRRAEKKDKIAATNLLLIILQDMELDFLIKYGEKVTLDVLQKAYDIESFRFGYKKGIVAEENGVIIGAAFGYLDTDEAVIDIPLTKIFVEMGISEAEKMFVDPEAEPNQWYLDSLVVSSDQRGKGIGGKLLDSLPNFIPEGLSIGLNVDQTNPQAKKLYSRHGFEVVGEKMISGHKYDHMIKENKKTTK